MEESTVKFLCKEIEVKLEHMLHYIGQLESGTQVLDRANIEILKGLCNGNIFLIDSVNNYFDEKK